MNGAHSTSRFWAAPAMLFLCCSFALFFIQFSRKIPEKGPAKIVRYCGTAAMAFAFLAITPLHDLMVTISGTLALVSMFYITIFILKARLHFFAALSILCLLVFYSSNFVYYTRIDLQALPVLQKATIGISITWLLCLQYFTTAADFQPRKPVSVNTNEAVVNN